MDCKDKCANYAPKAKGPNWPEAAQNNAPIIPMAQWKFMQEHEGGAK